MVLTTNTQQLINSSIRAKQPLHHYNLINLHQHHRLLSSTSKPPDPIETDNKTTLQQNEDEPPKTTTNEPEKNTETILEHDFNPSIKKHDQASMKKLNNLQLSQLSNSIYLRPIKQRLGSIRSKLSQELGHLPTRLSQLTGYGEIDKLKRYVSEKEADLRASRAATLDAKIKFNQAAQRRAESVKEVNDLLARKASWSDQDLARFTMLVRTDHANEQSETEAKKLLEHSESQVDHQFTSMMQAILTRYHEEQIWSDKIRALSTTFSLSITVINVLVFLAAIVLVEPYKRSKVVSEVEQRITARDSKNSELLDQALNVVVERLISTEKELSELVLALHPPSPPAPPVMDNSSTRDEREILDESIQTDKSTETKRVDKVEEEIDEETIPERFQVEEPPLQRSWADKLYDSLRQPQHPWVESDQDLVRAIGVGTLVGILVFTSFQFFSR